MTTVVQYIYFAVNFVYFNIIGPLLLYIAYSCVISKIDTRHHLWVSYVREGAVGKDVSRWVLFFILFFMAHVAI